MEEEFKSDLEKEYGVSPARFWELVELIPNGQSGPAAKFTRRDYLKSKFTEDGTSTRLRNATIARKAGVSRTWIGQIEKSADVAIRELIAKEKQNG